MIYIVSMLIGGCLLRLASKAVSRLLDLLPLRVKMSALKFLPNRIRKSIFRNGGSREIQWVTPFGSFRLQVSPNDDFYGMYANGDLNKWEYEALDYWYMNSREMGTVLDIGSYIGVYSLIASVDNGARRVVAFEPNPHGYSAIKRNLSLNSIDKKVSVHRVALGRNSNPKVLVAPKGRSFSSSVRIADSNFIPEADWEIVEQLEPSSLDDFLHSHDIHDVALVKIDTEGTELDILLGAQRLLENYHPKIIVECLNLESYLNIMFLLDPLGYSEGIALDGCHLQCSDKSHSECLTFATNYAFECPISV